MPLPAVSAVRSLVAATPSFNEEWNAPSGGANPDFTEVYPYETWLYFGNPGGVDCTSRVYPGTRNLLLDGKIDATRPANLSTNGNLYIKAQKMLSAQRDRWAADLAAHGVTSLHDYSSAVVTTRNRFEFTYGYSEIAAQLPMVSGTWPAWWQLPVMKTADNAGRLSEHDCFEHFGGVYYVNSGGVMVPIDRRGKPVSTTHYGTTGAEQKHTNGTVPSFPAIDVTKPHVYGHLWTPEVMRYYIDQDLVLEHSNPGICDPHYHVLSMDVADYAGDPSLGAYPANFIIQYLRTWPLV
jgi:beta-glucanase (GH16 family)